MRDINMLTARQAATAIDGWHTDGGGLYLRVRDKGGRRHWVFRHTRNGKLIEIGLGAARLVTLAQARQKAMGLREIVAEGKDPRAELRRAEAEQEAKKTFGEVATFVIERERKGWGASSLRAWTDSLNRDAKRLAPLDVGEIGVDDIKATVTPMFDRDAHVAARRTLGRIEAVLACAIAHGWRSSANVAAWDVFEHIAPKREKADRRHPMVPWREAPAAFAKLSEIDSMAARCVEFVALTAVRLTEARAAKWSEFDFERGLWTIPAERMKMRVEHTVPLSKQKLALLAELKAHRTGPYVFFGRDARGPVSADGCWRICSRVTDGKGSPHGWRATFRTWCGDHGVDKEAAESALAHAIGGTEGSYNRAAMIERRRPVMAGWAAFLAGESETPTVIPFTGARR
jgi:integrase